MHECQSMMITTLSNFWLRYAAIRQTMFKSLWLVMNTKFKLTGFCVSGAICTFICILPCDGAELGLMGLNWPLGLGIGSDLLWMYEFWDPSWKTYDFIKHAVFWAERRSSKVQVQICYISKGFSKQQAYSYFTPVPLARINVRLVPSHCIQKGQSAISTKRRLVWLVRCDKLQINSSVLQDC